MAWFQGWGLFFFPIPSRDVRFSSPRPAEVRVGGFRVAQGGFTPSLSQGSQQCLGTKFLHIFPFWKRAVSKEPIWPMAQEEGASKRHPRSGAESEIPPPARESRNELAELEVPETPVTELGKSQEHLFWEQEVHLVKRTGLASIYVL